MIWEELNPALIVTGLKAETSADVFREMGGRVTAEGYAKESYVQALNEREAEFPTGLDIDGIGVAIPHTSVEHVNKTTVSIGVLDHPVTFIEMGSDDDPVEVRLVFMLAVADPKKHMDELQRVLAIIQDKAVLEKLIACTDKQTIIDTIREKEDTL